MSVKGVCNQLTISERKYYRLKKTGILVPPLRERVDGGKATKLTLEAIYK
ncbi:hypothetical protein SAMN05444392_104165 [Seinonella peptonophila]|uniref:Uncharacterized protein n=2 Tax=Seinonella peptonophila TaxID=112248 RepID=A0A1M4X713_9BACL|nr:hypothetical protein SAMN05444392_104165 [Seinonella peptonophila]